MNFVPDNGGSVDERNGGPTSAAARKREMLEKKQQQLLERKNSSNHSPELMRQGSNNPTVRIVRPPFSSAGNSVVKTETAKKLISLGLSEEYDPRPAPTGLTPPGSIISESIAASSAPIRRQGSTKAFQESEPVFAESSEARDLNDSRASSASSSRSESVFQGRPPTGRDRSESGSVSRSSMLTEEPSSSLSLSRNGSGFASAGGGLSSKRSESSERSDAPTASSAEIPQTKPSKEKETSVSGPLSPTDLSRFDFTDLKSFVMKPVPEGSNLQCTVVRKTSGGIFSRFYPDFNILLSADSRFLCSAKKRMKNKAANYIVSLEKEATKDGDGYLGKVRSNFIGTEFLCYDAGIAPGPAAASSLVRKELGFIGYDKNILGHNGPRRMLVAIPTCDEEGDWTEWKPLTEESSDSLSAAARRVVGGGEEPNLLLLSNKPPEWNEKIQAHTLNFHGRVTKASVKNFQLCHYADNIASEKGETSSKPKNSDGSDIMLQFGRVTDDSFHLDVRHPMSLFQAISICLTSLDHKLGCE